MTIDVDAAGLFFMWKQGSVRRNFQMEIRYFCATASDAAEESRYQSLPVGKANDFNTRCTAE
jgi:hypothetical protein